MPWRPGQQVDRTLEAPYEDLPDHLREPVLTWIRRRLKASPELTKSVALRRRVAIPDPVSSSGLAVAHLMSAPSSDDAAALDLLEDMLAIGGIFQEYLLDLDDFLEEGHSAYQLNDDLNGLAMRVIPEVKEQVQQVVDAAAGAPGEHLAAAYNAAYGRTPDAERAYDRSIKAVEAALRPVISPKDSKATLTKMILALRDAPQKWTFALQDERDAPPANAPASDGVQVVLDSMRLLAYGQKQRHGEEGAVVSNTGEQVQAVVMLATTLVQWANVGAIVRVV